MKKTALIASVLTVVVFALLYLLGTLNNKNTPITYTVGAVKEELSIDDIIQRADVIVVGEAISKLPSKWIHHNDKDTKKAAPEEVFRAEGLFTDSIIAVDEVIKGYYKDLNIRVRSFIGETDRIRWQRSDQPYFTKGQVYLLFLRVGDGPTQVVDPGNYIAINGVQGVYEIIDGKAISGNDKWAFDELLVYIQKSLSNETALPMPSPTFVEEAPTSSPVPSAETPSETATPSPTPVPAELLVETPSPTEIPAELGMETPTEAPTPAETSTP